MNRGARTPIWYRDKKSSPVQGTEAAASVPSACQKPSVEMNPLKLGRGSSRGRQPASSGIECPECLAWQGVQRAQRGLFRRAAVGKYWHFFRLTAWARKLPLPCLFCKRFPWVVTISDAWSYTKQKSGNPPAPDLNRPFLFPPQGGVTYEENRTCPLCQRRFKYSSDFWPSRHCSGRVWTMSLNSVNLNLTGFAGSCQTTEELHISIEGIQFGL